MYEFTITCTNSQPTSQQKPQRLDVSVEEKDCQPRIVYSDKLFFKNEGKLRCFQRNKTREFAAS
jgi:hypothetical protein